MAQPPSAASTLSVVDYIVKTIFKGGVPTAVCSKNHVLFSRLKRDPNFYGKQVERPVRVGNPQGISNDFATAQDNDTPHVGDRWVLTRKKKYGYYTMDAELIHATARDEGAFVREVKYAVDTLLESWGDDAATELWGTSSGLLARVSGTPSANVITLATADDAYKFSKDMKLEVWSAESGGSERSGTFVITAVNEEAGTITVTDDGAAADGDYIFRDGNRGAAINGVKAWIPDAAPTDTFNGVDRSVNSQLLGGFRIDATTADLDEALLDLAAKIQKRKPNPHMLEGYMSPTNFTNLVHKLGSKIERTEGGGATFGFEYISMATPAGTYKMFSDPDCRPDAAYLLDMSVCGIMHMKELPHLVNDDGMTMARLTDADGIEFRARGWWEFFCEAPGRCGVVKGL